MNDLTRMSLQKMSSTILQFAFLSQSKAGARKIRDLAGLPASLGFVGPLEIRLAQTKKDIRKVQRLRFKVFYEQGGARADARASLTGRDICPYDRYCDHLLIIDHAHRNRFGQIKPKVVGTYRLLRQDTLPQGLSLYSAQEFNLAPLLARHADKRFLELGRSCVLPDYRGKRTIELLWRGIWTYVKHHRIDVMIGCASFDTINPQTISLPLNFLHQTALAQGEWQVSALTKRAIAPTRLDTNKTEFQPAQLRQALHALPPLIKGYLRVGARFGSGAVVDYQFGTTDVLVIMPVKDIDPRYIDHFDSALTRPCAA